MPDKILPHEQILSMLESGPPRLTATTAGLAPALLQLPPSPGEWSANDVLAHLRSCADVWGNCIDTILTQKAPTIRAINPRTWINSTDYLEQDFRPSLRAFTSQRTALLKLLESLPKKSWARQATVTVAGKALERTVHFYAQWLATHERPHIKQIERIADAVRAQK